MGRLLGKGTFAKVYYGKEITSGESVAIKVLRKKGYDGAKADIWSCGVVLYALLAGCLPFRDENLMNMYRKIFRADFEFPPWFSPESRRLVSRLLVVDPDRRISVTEIMRTPWLRENFNPPLAFEIDDREETEAVSPKFFNAFEFISSMSSGFDLSSLFQSKRKVQSVFTSRSSAAEIMEKIETGKTEGRKGRLSMTAEVFEVAPEMSVVEFCKSAGDTLEYNRFYEEVRPALNDIVWSWHGDNTAVNQIPDGHGTV
ncbi:hypothetical protein HID58_039387 [Brassica napus]|uniref:non-specific serine/threonine protein kinase n=1 Tax=Brassica napus TaxID=3708 RepID=A0ABQ8BRW7_BRANA|nr:hypothetical protein HID58_039387 [Brassica napus]